MDRILEPTSNANHHDEVESTAIEQFQQKLDTITCHEGRIYCSFSQVHLINWKCMCYRFTHIRTNNNGYVKYMLKIKQFFFPVAAINKTKV